MEQVVRQFAKVIRWLMWPMLIWISIKDALPAFSVSWSKPLQMWLPSQFFVVVLALLALYHFWSWFVTWMQGGFSAVKARWLVILERQREFDPTGKIIVGTFLIWIVVAIALVLWFYSRG
jgi:hypothetical protein